MHQSKQNLAVRVSLEFQLLSILGITWYCPFNFYHLVGTKWYLIVVLVCILQVTKSPLHLTPWKRELHLVISLCCFSPSCAMRLITTEAPSIVQLGAERSSPSWENGAWMILLHLHYFSSLRWVFPFYR